MSEIIFQKAEHTLQKTRYTVKDFDLFVAQPENADRLYELLDGEVVEKVVTEEHRIIVLNAASPIREFVRQHRLGRVGVEINHRSAGDRYNDRIPAIAYTADTTRPIVTQGSVPQMPDLAIEVKSPNDRYAALRRKAEYYLQNGTRLVWLIYPERQSTEVCRLSDDPDLPGAMRIDTVGIDGELSGEDVLPGFRLSVREIFDL